MVFRKELEDVYIYIDGVVDCHEIPFDEEDNSDYDLDSGAVAEND